MNITKGLNAPYFFMSYKSNADDLKHLYSKYINNKKNKTGGGINEIFKVSNDDSISKC